MEKGREAPNARGLFLVETGTGDRGDSEPSSVSSFLLKIVLFGALSEQIR